MGLFYGMSYILSGYNLAVPIVAHGLYNCGTIILAWMFATTDLRRRFLQVANTVSSDDVWKTDAVNSMVFEFLDFNGDGYIDKQELEFGLQIIQNDITASNKKNLYELFETLDINCDGKIDFIEFTTITK